MTFRNDLARLRVLISLFQDFDHGGTIKQTIPAGWNLRPGDRFNWETTQFNGVAEVIDIVKVNEKVVLCVFKKIK